MAAGTIDAGTSWRTRDWCVAAWLLLFLPVAAPCDTPVTPNASPEAQSLLTYLHDIYGKTILSGQQEGWRGTNELGFELRHIQQTTGKLPAILGLEAAGMMFGRRERVVADRSPVVNHAIDWYSNRNGIVSFCWHWAAPIGKRVFYSKETDFDAARATTPGTPEYEAVLRDLDTVAGQLKLLQAARVPVLWRPLHEANGRWFWWGAAGPDACKKLWRLMYERFTVHHQLDNLLWVFSPGAGIDLAEWYPGDAYVDVIGQDHYPMDGNHGAAKVIFDELMALTGGAKLVGMSENGAIPDPAEVSRDKAGWLFFITWGGSELTKHNTPEQLKEYYHHPYVASLGDLPDLKHYPFKPASKAVKLAFTAKPEAFGINSPARRAVSVLVQDAAGRTTRTGSYVVTLDSATALGGRKFTATSVNGTATFPDLIFERAAQDCVLTATAPGLEPAKSQRFLIGPGSGVLRETWTSSDGKQNTPLQREIVRKAFEVPVRMATNFSARFTAQLIPPQTGEYQFWIANDGLSELWLSTDATPARKVKIAAILGDTPYAKWPHTHEAASPLVKLVAGERYHLEVRQTQHAGATHLSVRWRLPDGTEERPIPAARLIPPDAAETDPKLSQTNTP